MKEECLSKVVLFRERSLRRALSEYVEHFHAERNHQGRGTSCCSPGVRTSAATGLFNAAIDWADSLRYYHQEAARGRRFIIR